MKARRPPIDVLVIDRIERPCGDRSYNHHSKQFERDACRSLITVGTNERRSMTTRVTIVPYDPDWPRRFDEERSVLADVLAGSDAIIEHVGSTAVPGLRAKPVVDPLRA